MFEKEEGVNKHWIINFYYLARYFVSKIVLTYCEKKLLKFEAEC